MAVEQVASAIAHLGAKRQPAGQCPGAGTLPGMAGSRSRPPPISGTERIRARV